MAKQDNMIAYIKDKSAQKEKIALEEMKKMYEQGEQITIAELVRRTHLSRAYFYNHARVKTALQEYLEKQQGKVLRNPKHESIEKAQKKLIEELQRKLKNSVPKSEYDSLKMRYDELLQQRNANIFDSL